MGRRDPRSRRSRLRSGSVSPQLLSVSRSHGRAGRARGHCRQHSRGTPGGRRGDEHAPGSVAVGAPADETISAPPRRADSASALSMIESVSISSPSATPPEATRQVHRRDMHRQGRGGACCGGHGADDQAGVDGDVLDGERVEQCADGAAPSRTTAPGSQAQASQALASRRLGHAAEPVGVTAARSS